MGDSPRISVVIPSHGRETRLAFALDALAAQTLDRADFEVLVVRDGTPRRAAAAPEGLHVRFLERVPRGGPAAAARNVGWREARAGLVAFTDDDCRPSPGWLKALLDAFADDFALVQGRTEPDPDERHLLGGLARTQVVVAPTGWYQTCNIAYPRALLERLGGFDEDYTRAGEDTDLAMRALEAGARAVFEPEALVWHAVHPRHLPEALRETVRWGANPRLLGRHPGLRRLLPLGMFWKASHPRLLLFLAGLAAARRSPLAGLLVLPYLELHLRTYDHTSRGLARAALDLPSRTAVDGLEVGVTAVAAARERVPVL